MRKQADIPKSFWNQIIIWLPSFLIPILYALQGRTSWQDDLSVYIIPLSMMAVAYTNYFALAPMLLKGRKKELWVINTLLILFLSITQHEWLYYISDEQNLTTYPYQIFVKNKEGRYTYPYIFLAIRSVFSLGICAGVATSILMAQRWLKAEKEKREAETAMTKAELVNLRQQANPHFLLNTMNNIYALTVFDTEKAQKAVIDLSKMLRHILYDNQQPYVCLKEEVELLHNYVDLMVIRIPENVEIKHECNISSSCNIHVAPMIFISLLGNAFKHGINPEQKNFIHIRLDADNEQVIFPIQNSSDPEEEAERNGHSVGLKQVERRLELACPGKYKWEKGFDRNRNTYSSKTIIYDTRLYDH